MIKAVVGFDHSRHLWCKKDNIEIVLSEMKDQFYFSLFSSTGPTYRDLQAHC